MPTPQDILVYAIVLAVPWCAVWLWRRDVFRPGSLSRLAAAGRMRNPAAINAGIWLGASAATFFAAIVGAGLAAAALGLRSAADRARDPASAALADVVTYLFAAMVGLLCTGLITKGGRNLGAEPRLLGLEARGSDALRGLGGLLVVLPLCVTAGVAASLIAKVLHQEAPRIGHAGLSEMVANRYTWHAWVRALMAVVGAPVVEELIYRVFLQSAIISALTRLRWAGSEGIGGPPVANAREVFWGITLSTIGFVLPHAAALNGPASWNALPPLAILGVALGVVYERTRSPLAPMAMHAGFNAVNVGLAMATAGATVSAAG